MYNSFTVKSLFILLIFLIIRPPFNEIIHLVIIILVLFIIYSTKLKHEFAYNLRLIIYTFAIIVISNFTNYKDIREANSTFFSKKDIDIINEFLPKKIMDDINHSYKSLDINRVLKSWDSPNYSNEDKFNAISHINEPFSFSSDNFFYKSSYTRVVNKIDFKNREDLRIGQINNIKYNLVNDKYLRRELPYYVYFEIPKRYVNSEICTKGNAYFTYLENDKNIIVKNLNFKKLPKQSCIKFIDNNKKLFIIGYSINLKDNLEIKLNKNILLKFNDILNLLLVFIFIIIYFRNYLYIEKLTTTKNLVFLISVVSSIIIIFLKDSNLITGLRYFRGGADGLFHEDRAILILHSLYNMNFLEVLKGGEDIYYFMPGLRYFIAFGKIFFGESSYGYLIIGILLPLFIFRLLKNLISENVAFYLTLSFLIIPIFENMGFGHFNYIHQIMRNHGETLSITIIVYVLSKLTSKNYLVESNSFNLFYTSFLLAFSVFCRPNFFPAANLIILYLLIVFYKIQIRYIFFILLGYSFVFTSLFHNIYFGNSLSFFTKSNLHFVFDTSFRNFNLTNISDNLFVHQITKWNPIYNIHRLIILFFTIFCFFKFKKNLIINILFLIVISQHFVLLITHPDSRYAYLAWLITFILFCYYLFNFYLKKFK